MTWWMWTLVSVVTYMVGFIITAAWDERSCDHKLDGHVYRDPESYYRSMQSCNHPWDNGASLFWPVVALALTAYAPFWALFGGSTKIAHKLATIPTHAERKAAKAEAARKLEIEKDEERKRLARRIKELEAEVGVKQKESTA